MNILGSFYNQLLHKFYTGLKIYVDYQGGLSTNDGLSPQAPVDTIATALNRASGFYSLAKMIIVMRGNPTKKGDIIDEPISINIPNTVIDFNFIPIRLTVDGIAISLQEVFTGVVNANIDLFDQPTYGEGIVMNGGLFNFVVNSLIQNCKGSGISGYGSGKGDLIMGNILINNDVGLWIKERGGIIVQGNLFALNSTAIKSDGGNGQAFVTRNIFQSNIVDVEEQQFYQESLDGVGSLNKLTSPSASWAPGQYTGFLLIDSAGNGYKITGNTATELNVVGVNFDGSAKDVTPADGHFWIVHSENDVFFYENYWDKLKNASLQIYGDSNEDGILDRLISMPEFGIGIGKSTVIDKKPLTMEGIFSDANILDTSNLILNQLYFLNSREFQKALTDMPNRNIRAGMLDFIRWKIWNQNYKQELDYDSSLDVIKTKIIKE